MSTDDRPPRSRSGVEAVGDAAPAAVEVTARLADRSSRWVVRTAPRLIWERRVNPPTRVWVRGDDVVVLGDDLVDPSSGDKTHRPSTFVDLDPWSIVYDPIGPAAELAAVPPEHKLALCRRWRGHLAVAAMTGWGLAVEIMSADGAIRAQHRATDDRATRMWQNWFAEDLVGVVRAAGATAATAGAEPSVIELPEPLTGATRWSLPADPRRWPLLPSDTRSAGTSSHGQNSIVAHRRGVAAVGHNSSVAWSLSTPGETWVAEVVTVGGRSDGRDLVIVFEVSSRSEYGESVRITIRDRSDGTIRWSRWVQCRRNPTGIGAVGSTSPGGRLARSAIAATGDAVIYVDDKAVRARSLDDELLWMIPLEDLDPPPARHQPPLVRLRNSGDPGSANRRWTWLTPSASSSGRSAFIDSQTGRLEYLDGAFHLTGSDLVLTYADGLVQCLALSDDNRS